MTSHPLTVSFNASEICRDCAKFFPTKMIWILFWFNPEPQLDQHFTLSNSCRTYNIPRILSFTLCYCENEVTVGIPKTGGLAKELGDFHNQCVSVCVHHITLQTHKGNFHVERLGLSAVVLGCLYPRCLQLIRRSEKRAKSTRFRNLFPQFTNPESHLGALFNLPGNMKHHLLPDDYIMPSLFRRCLWKFPLPTL